MTNDPTDPLSFMRGHANFANWCEREKVTPFDAAYLIVLTRKAVKAGTREANGTLKSADNARAQVEQHAKKMGIHTTWSGLAPTFTRDGFELHLPQY